MAFLDNIGKTISSKSKDVAKKAKDMAEIAGLNGKISTQEEIIRKAYIEIGKAYYEKYKNDNTNEYATECEKITLANDEILKLKSEIQAIKSSKVCPNCGAEITEEAVFCAKCGYKFETQTKDSEETESKETE
jgi:ribosomal protein L40E